MIIVTGATGFTGKYAVQKLLEAGYEVSCLVRRTSHTDELDRMGVKIIYGDLDDFDSLLSAFSQADTLVNIASLGFGHASNIISASEQAGIKRAVFFSTTGIFTQLNPQSKTVRLEAESIIEASKLDYTIIRPTMIYGTHADRNMCRLVKLVAKSPIIPILGSGEFLQQPVYVEDLAKAVVLALKSPKSVRNDYNIPGGKPYTYNQVIDITAKYLNKRVMKIHIPLSFCLLLLRMYERTTKKPKIKAEQALRLNENKDFSIDKAQQELGYTAYTFEDGIALEIEEMKQLKMI